MRRVRKSGGAFGSTSRAGSSVCVVVCGKELRAIRSIGLMEALGFTFPHPQQGPDPEQHKAEGGWLRGLHERDIPGGDVV